MLSINFTKEINASKDTVWGVMTDTSAYPEWNPFVVACKSSFIVGSPIVMKVRLLPSLTITQKETIQQNRSGEFLAYGINIPLSILFAKYLQLGSAGVILATALCLMPVLILARIQYHRIINKTAKGIWNE